MNNSTPPPPPVAGSDINVQVNNKPEKRSAWVKRKPTKPGIYWFRENPGSEIYGVLIQNGLWISFQDGILCPLEHFGGEWQPVKPPEE